MGIPLVDAWLSEQRSADEKALRCQAAYATGNFDAYWQAEGEAAQKRLDELYGRSSDQPEG